MKKTNLKWVLALLILTSCSHLPGQALRTYEEPVPPKCFVVNELVIENECYTPVERWDLADYILKLRLKFRQANDSLKLLNK